MQSRRLVRLFRTAASLGHDDAIFGTTTTADLVAERGGRHKQQAASNQASSSSAPASAAGWGGLAGGLAEELAGSSAAGFPKATAAAAWTSGSESVVGDALLKKAPKVKGAGGSWRDKLKATKAAKAAAANTSIS